MFEIVKAIHEALHTESTWTFVLVIALAFGAVAGGVAWTIDRGYKNSLQENADPIQLSLTCDTVNLPLPHSGDMWSLDTAVFLKGLVKQSVNPLKPDWYWPEKGVSGIGFQCVVKNHSKTAAFSVEIPLGARRREIIQGGNGDWHSGNVTETYTPVVYVPQPLGPQDSFTFYVCSYYPDRVIEITIPTFAYVNTDEANKKTKVELRVASTMGNPFFVAPTKRSSR